MYIYGNISLNSSQNEKCCRQKKFRTHFVFNKNFSKICAVYEIMRKKYSGTREAMDGNIIQCRKGEPCCWITKATNTHSEYVIFISFLCQQLSRERTDVVP